MSTFTITRAGRAWHFVGAIGNDSVMVGLRYPASVAVAGDGSIFVLSRGMPTYAGEGASEGGKLGKWSMDGLRIGDFARMEFAWPVGMAIAGDGNVFCSDESENFVAAYSADGPFYDFPEYNPDGEYRLKWGETGSAAGQFDGPAGLAFDGEDNLYVVDSRNHRIQKFTKDGRYLDGWGGHGSGDGQFAKPWGITVDREGNVFVADWGNSRVQKLSPDGEFLMSFGSDHESGGDLDHPADVAVDGDGDVYVADWGNKRVQIYEPDGEIIGALHGNATDVFDRLVQDQFQLNEETRKAHVRVEGGTLLGRFNRPVALAVDSDDTLYVADSRRCRVQIYSKENGFIDAAADM